MNFISYEEFLAALQALIDGNDGPVLREADTVRGFVAQTREALRMEHEALMRAGSMSDVLARELAAAGAPCNVTFLTTSICNACPIGTIVPAPPACPSDAALCWTGYATKEATR